MYYEEAETVGTFYESKIYLNDRVISISKICADKLNM